MTWPCSKCGGLCGDEPGKPFFWFFKKVICPRCLELWVTGEVKVNVKRKKKRAEE